MPTRAAPSRFHQTLFSAHMSYNDLNNAQRSEYNREDPHTDLRMPPLTNKHPDSTTMAIESVPEIVLLETSYDEDLGSSQTEGVHVSDDKPWQHFPLLPSPPSIEEINDWSDFPLFSKPPSLEELSSDSSCSSDESLLQDPIEVRLSDDHSLDSVSFHSCTSVGLTESDAKGSPKQKHVSFSTVEIREYAVIVGNHPCCSAGLPLSLDWKYNPYPIIKNVNDVGKQTPARRLSLLERMHLLKKFYSSADLWSAEGERRRELDEEEEEVSPLHHVMTLGILICDDTTIIIEPEDCAIPIPCVLRS